MIKWEAMVALIGLSIGGCSIAVSGPDTSLAPNCTATYTLPALDTAGGVVTLGVGTVATVVGVGAWPAAISSSCCA